MSKPYKLSTILYGHSLDVRSIATTSDNGIVSGSRDKTAKYWRSNGFNAGYTEAMSYRDQNNFVASVLYIEPTESHPEGLIITGGNDNKILLYKPNEPFACFTITNHTDAVCCLSRAQEKNHFLSGSWDKTGKLWSLASLKAPVAAYAGHAAALWSIIQLSNGNIVTASADRTIGLWKADGQQIRSITGHTDCVRGVCDFPEMEYFISVANDALIKVWNYAGDNIDNIHGHNNYIYCITRNPALGPNTFVTGDENFSVKCWKDGVNIDTIRLPSQSVWSLACLSNGDIVTGTSDGVIRIFSQDEARIASQEALKEFEEEVNVLQKQMAQDIGGYKVSDLPGREALYDPGKTAGQIKMIRDNGSVVAYSWVEDGDKSHWEKVGDVLGANEKANEGKTMHEGKHYDFVFSVDVEDGKPPLKLPYNIGEDVYDAANKFITKNYLPAAYLDQVVDFIQKNSQSQQPVAPANDYVDPFTGSSRYTPASTSAGLGAASGFNYDPLTGGSSYNTSSGTGSTQTKAGPAGGGGNADPFTGACSYTTMPANVSHYFPHHKYLKFDGGDPKVILGKLKEFNEKIGDGNHKVDEQQLDNLYDLCTKSCTNDEVYDGLFKLLEWPQDMLFPVIDVMRLAVRHEVNGNKIVLKDSKKLIDLFKACINQTNVPNNTLLAFRTLCNLFSNSMGQQLLHTNQFELLEIITALTPSNKNIEIGMATFLLNLSILCITENDEMGVILLSTILPDTISNCEDPEAHFRTLVAIGNLLCAPNTSYVQEIKAKVNENSIFLQKLQSFITGAAGNDLKVKRQSCSKQIHERLA